MNGLVLKVIQSSTLESGGGLKGGKGDCGQMACHTVPVTKIMNKKGVGACAFSHNGSAKNILST